MSHLIAAIDESMRSNCYLMCATIASTNDRPHIRQSLRALLLPNQRRLHAYNEREGRRRMLLKSMTTISGIACHVVVGRERRMGARHHASPGWFPMLLIWAQRKSFLNRWILERRSSTE